MVWTGLAASALLRHISQRSHADRHLDHRAAVVRKTLGGAGGLGLCSVVLTNFSVQRSGIAGSCGLYAGMDVRSHTRGKSSALAADSRVRAGDLDRDDPPEYGGRPGAAGDVYLLAIWCKSRMVVVRDQRRSIYCFPFVLLAGDYADLGALVTTCLDTLSGSLPHFCPIHANRFCF